MEPAPLDGVLASLSRTLGAEPGAVARPLGEVVLSAEQAGTAALVHRRLQHHGGVVLADAVGTGKTYVAIAVARAWPQVTVACPAALRTMWREALTRTGLVASVVSLESLSRRPLPLLPPGGLLIVDEAHHLRNSQQRRYAHLATLAWGQALLLLTATPVHNAPRDLAALVALYAGRGAHDWSSASLRAQVVRRAGEEAGLPRVGPVTWFPAPVPPALLEAITRLPPPVPPADGGAAAALGTLALVRQACSSHAALAAAVRRRVGRALAMESRLQAGHVPTRAELRRLLVDEGTVQLDLLLPTGAPAARDLLSAVGHYLQGLRTLQQQVRAHDDTPRLALLRDVLARHPEAQVACFSHSADTALATFRGLVHDVPCAVVTGGGARIASGPVPRDEVLAAFLPGARPRLPRHLDLRVLVTTDVLSEGVNLHGAAVLVHLDLTWTAARLQQRVGRLRRRGSPWEALAVYGLSPPETGERLTRVLRRLARKAAASRRASGIDVGSEWLPGGYAARPRAPVSPDGSPGGDAIPPWCTGVVPRPGVASAWTNGEGGLVAVVRAGDGEQVVAAQGHVVTTDPHVVRQRLASVVGEAPGDAAATARALRVLERWARGVETRRQVTPPGSDVHREVLRLLAAWQAGAGRAERGDRHRRATAAADLVLRSVGVGAERALAEWRRSLDGGRMRTSDVDALVARLDDRARPRTAEGPAAIHALVVLRPRRRTALGSRHASGTFPACPTASSSSTSTGPSSTPSS